MTHPNARSASRAEPGSARPLFFYSTWPLGYHNLEAERKAIAFAAAGYEVVYVAGVGIRNPRPSSVTKVFDRLGRKVGSHRRAEAEGVRAAGVLVVPPRQWTAVHRINVTWLDRQIRHAVPDWQRAVAWIRWPTPELVDVLARRRPAVIVYECVDAYHVSPGITGPWRARHENAERQLVALAHRVVVPSEGLARRFRAWGADVRVVPHGVDLFPWTPRRRASGPPTVGFVGTLDYKLDVPLLRYIAARHPEWHLRLIGPVQQGFTPSDLADIPNVRVEPPVPHEQLGEALAEFDVGILPYLDDSAYRDSAPLKNLELMAAGLPAVARPTESLLPYSDLLYFAGERDLFVRQLERALAEDTEDLARKRRTVAEEHPWDARTTELVCILATLGVPPY